MKGDTSIKKIKSKEIELIQKIASFYYEKELSQPTIAKRLNVSQVQVSRYLKTARDKGIVTITVKSSDLSRLEQNLIQRFNLKDVKLIYKDEGYGNDILYYKIGQELARYFEDIVHDGFKIGMSGGRTMVQFVESVSSEPKEVEIYPLTLWGLPIFIESVNPSILLSILFHKFRPKAKCLRYEVPPLKSYKLIRKELEENIRITREKLRELDILLTGVGYLDYGNPFVALCKAKNISIEELKEKGIVGNIFSHMLNDSGEEIFLGKELEDYFLELLSLRDLKKLAEDKNKFIILASGGGKRLPIIKACLKARLFNVLITDSETGEELLK